jgi:hypothetical protein
VTLTWWLGDTEGVPPCIYICIYIYIYIYTYIHSYFWALIRASVQVQTTRLAAARDTAVKNVLLRWKGQSRTTCVYGYVYTYMCCDKCMCICVWEIRERGHTYTHWHTHAFTLTTSFATWAIRFISYEWCLTRCCHWAYSKRSMSGIQRAQKQALYRTSTNKPRAMSISRAYPRNGLWPCLHSQSWIRVNSLAQLILFEIKVVISNMYS